MLPHRKTKRRLKLEERFKADAIGYLTALGAQLGRFYDYDFDTPAGLLHMTPYGDWIACRFDDVALGRRFTDDHGPACNPHSGKWNFRYEFSKEFGPEQALADFRRYIERLLGWKAAAA